MYILSTTIHFGQHSKPQSLTPKRRLTLEAVHYVLLRERSNTKKKKTPYPPPPIIFWRFSTFHLCLFVNPCLLQQTLFFFLMLILGFPCRIFFLFFSFWISDSYPTSCFFFFFPFFSFLLCFFFSLFFFLFFFRGVGEEMWRGTKSDTDG